MITHVEPSNDANRLAPKYHRVKAEMLARIADGIWSPGMAISPELDLCEEFGVSRITVRRAIGDLIHDGKLQAVQGKGTFVTRPKLQERFVQRASGFYEDMERRGIQPQTVILRQDTIPAPADVASWLGRPAGERVHIVVRTRAVQDETILVSTTYIPEMLCPDLMRHDLAAGSLYRLLRQDYGLKIARGERNLEAVAAGFWEARILDVPLASPLLRLDSVAYRADGQAFEYSQALHRGDRARIAVEFYPGPEED